MPRPRPIATRNNCWLARTRQSVERRGAWRGGDLVAVAGLLDFASNLDKRYTNPKLRQALEQAVGQELTPDGHQGLLIWHEDSQGQLCLQAVDFVAWAIAQKYERSDESAYARLAGRIIVEEVIAESLW